MWNHNIAVMYNNIHYTKCEKYILKWNKCGAPTSKRSFTNKMLQWDNITWEMRDACTIKNFPWRHLKSDPPWSDVFSQSSLICMIRHFSFWEKNSPCGHITANDGYIAAEMNLKESQIAELERGKKSRTTFLGRTPMRRNWMRSETHPWMTRLPSDARLRRRGMHNVAILYRYHHAYHEIKLTN